MNRILFLLTLFFLFCQILDAQNSISGRIIDADTHQPLAFVNIIVVSTVQGATSDIDGRFLVKAPFQIHQLQFSYVGYETRSLDPGGSSELIVKLKKKALLLSEVKILPGINPADRIIRNASANRKTNNAEKNAAFIYTSYNKLYVTADFKSDLDTINSLDTTKHKETRAQKLFEKQHLFLSETVTKKKHLPPGMNHEEVIASRTSGMKTPLLAALGYELQGFSFYDNTIKLLDRVYVSPLVEGSEKMYYFTLEDTLYTGVDTVFVLSYRPRLGKKFDAVKGVLYINTNRFAIQNVIAEPVVSEGLFTIRIQQKFEFLGGKQWFPVQLNTDLYYNDFSVKDTSIVISFGAGKKAQANNSGKLKIVNRSYISDVVINPPLKRREFGSLELEVAPDAPDKDEVFWKKYRIDSLNARDKRTYQVLDSAGQASHLDLKMRALSALVDGQLPWKYIAFDLNRILNFNAYEVVRLGLGIHTSNRVSRYFSLGGYGAYGFGDTHFKYGGDVNIFPNPRNHEYAITYSYRNDLVESGGISFLREYNGLSAESFRTELLAVYDKQEMQKIAVRFRLFSYLLGNLYFSNETRTATTPYRYGYAFDNGAGSVTWNQFFFTEGGLQLKYVYREKFTEFLDTRISEGSDYPVVFANLAKGFNNIPAFGGAYDYTKYELKIFKRFITPKAGKLSFELMGGYVQGNLPYTKLFAGRGSFVNYSVTVPNTFETMGVNEFLSDRYVALFYTHDFGRLFFRKEHFQPEVLLVNKVGFGSLSNEANHFDVQYKTMEKGYYETGLLLNNIIRRGYFGLGAGVYYRYGPYAFTDQTQNVAVKFSFSFNF